MTETNILMGWYSPKQHQTQADRVSLQIPQTGSHLYQHEAGEAVVVTEVIPAGRSSRWPDAACVGRVITYLGPGPSWEDVVTAGLQTKTKGALPVNRPTKTREGP